MTTSGLRASRDAIAAIRNTDSPWRVNDVGLPDDRQDAHGGCDDEWNEEVAAEEEHAPRRQHTMHAYPCSGRRERRDGRWER